MSSAPSTSRSHHITAAPVGRAAGTSNWTAIETDALAAAVAEATTDPAVGTDQASAVYWDKVFALFQQKVPTSNRSMSAIHARWTNPVQKHVNKYVGIVNAVMREYHSGWQLQDYMNHAKFKFQEANGGKPFKYEGAYNILKRLPKYALDMPSLDSKVKNALGLDMDTDNTFTCAPRPAVGKKKGKRMKFEAEEKEKEKRAKISGPVEGSEAKPSPDVCLHRLSVAAEAKNQLMKESLMYNFFSTCPDSPSKTKYYEMMAVKYAAELDDKVAVVAQTTKFAVEALPEPTAATAAEHLECAAVEQDASDFLV